MKEKEFYDIVKNFLLKVKKCEKVVVNKVSFREIKKWIIDVVGIKEHKIYCVEVKRNLSFDSMFAALKQAEFMCTACTDVYVCFPKEDYINAENELRKYLMNTASNMGIGILLIDKNHIEEIKKPVVEKFKKRIDFRNYYFVLTQLVGKLNIEKKKRLVIGLGLLELIKWYEDLLNKYKNKSQEYGNKIGQFIAFDTIRYIFKTPLFSQYYREKAEKALESIIRESTKKE